jgi:hypothetical protein
MLRLRPSLSPNPSWLPEPAPTSKIMRISTAVGMGAVAAALSTVPAALRTSSAIASNTAWWQVWIAFSGSTVLPMVLAVIAFRGAAQGALALFRERLRMQLGIALFSAAGLYTGLLLLGATLHTNTHHRGLAGATFGVLALMVTVGALAVSQRVASLVERYVPSAQRVLPYLGGGALLLAVAWSLRSPASRGEPTALFLDLLAFTLMAGFASQAAFARLRPLALAGPPAACALVLLACTTLRGSPELVKIIVEQAPAFGQAARIIAGAP